VYETQLAYSLYVELHYL